MEENTEQEQKPEKKEAGLFEELLGDVLNLDRGLPATIYNMFVNPRLVIDSYFTDRGRFVNPIRYTIFIMAFTTAITVYFIDYERVLQEAANAGAQGGDFNASLEDLKEKTGLDWPLYFEMVGEVTIVMTTKLNQLLYIVLLAPALAFFSKLFFKSKKPYFKHHYVMYLYSLASFSALSLFFFPLMMIENFWATYTTIVVVLQLGFTFYVQSKYLELKGFEQYAMSFLSFLFGYITYTIISIIIMYGAAAILFIVRT